MHQHMSDLNSKLDKTMTTEQFEQVVEAILAGKYSWACVLILRFAGYNPLHYIPYRTYNRLLKENSPFNRGKQNQTDAMVGKVSSTPTPNQSCGDKSMTKIKDLAYLEVVGKQKTEVMGGCNSQWLDAKASDQQEDIAFEIEPVSHVPFKIGKLL